MPTIGQTLEDTRRSRGLSIEDVAHATRIHPNMIVLIEENDFSQFPSVAYAKSFIRKYSDHLGVDLTEAMDALNSGVTRLGDNELMGEIKTTIQKDRRFRLERFTRSSGRRPEKAGGAPLFLNVVLVALMAALGIFYFLGYNAPTPERARQEIVRGLGLADPAPVEPGVALLAPAVETNPLKPAGMAHPAEPAAPPEPAEKPAVVSSLEAAPATLGDLPAVLPPGTEPAAALRPEGTDPAATTTRSPEILPVPSTAPAPVVPAPPQPIRATPVAASE